MTGVLPLRLALALIVVIICAADPESDHGGGDSVADFDVIEMPEVLGLENAPSVSEGGTGAGMTIRFDSPTPGRQFKPAEEVVLVIATTGVPPDEGWSAMVYFGGGNPFPVDLPTGQTVSMKVADLPPGNYSVSVILLSPERQPVQVQHEVNFQRLGAAPAKDYTKYEARALELLQRTPLAQTADGPDAYHALLRELAESSDEYRSRLEETASEEGEGGGNLAVADEVLAQAALLLFSPRHRDWAMAAELASHCGELGSGLCRFLAAVLTDMGERDGLAADTPYGAGLLEECARGSPPCRMALAFSQSRSILSPTEGDEDSLEAAHSEGGADNVAGRRGGKGGKEACDQATVNYRLAADVSLMFSHENAGTARLHAVRLLEHTAVAKEHTKVENEVKLVEQASRGDAAAAGVVAIDRLLGSGYTGSGNRTHDRTEAAALLEQAAEGADALALNNLGVVLQNGVGVTKDLPRAAALFARAAELGNHFGINSLAHCYIMGLGVEANRSRGIELWHRAANLGNAQAHMSLGLLYRDGHGPCPPHCRDFAKAYSHLDQAASRGDSDALLFLGIMLKAGEYVGPDCPLALKAFKQCAERGPWADLLRQAFQAWDTGDKAGAFIRYRLAAEMGYRTALANVGFFYEEGVEGVLEKDAKRAVAFYSLAADQGDVVCRRRLGDLLYYGLDGTPPDYPGALAHYRRAPNDAQSVFNVAGMLERGEGAPRDLASAREMYDSARELGGGSGHQKRRMPMDADDDPALAALPASLAIGRLDLMEVMCPILVDLSALARDLLLALAPLLPASPHAALARWSEGLAGWSGLRGLVESCEEQVRAPEPGGGAASVEGDILLADGFLTFGGVGLEIWVAAIAGMATTFTVMMGPCFWRMYSRRLQRLRGEDFDD